MKINVNNSPANPLFACMPGAVNDVTMESRINNNTPPENYLTIAKMLIDQGIDTTVRYDMSYGPQIDAMMFALIWGRNDIAHLIADHQAEGDAAAAEQLLNEARAAVEALPATED